MKDSFVYRFKLKDILTENKYHKVHYDHQSRNKYYACYENCLVIMPDQKTLLGVDNENLTDLIQEDISDMKSPIITVNKHSNIIYTISFDAMTNTLMVGDYSSSCIQYKRRTDDWEIVNV